MVQAAKVSREKGFECPACSISNPKSQWSSEHFAYLESSVAVVDRDGDSVTDIAYARSDSDVGSAILWHCPNSACEAYIDDDEVTWVGDSELWECGECKETWRSLEDAADCCDD